MPAPSLKGTGTKPLGEVLIDVLYSTDGKNLNRELVKTSKTFENAGFKFRQALGLSHIIAQVVAIRHAFYALKKVVNVAGKALRSVLDEGAYKQRLDLGLTVLMGDAEKANKMLGKMRDTALTLPQTLKDVEQVGLQLLAAGEVPEFIPQTIRALSDLSSAFPQADFKRLGDAVAQVRSMGRLTGYTIRRFEMAGINMREILMELPELAGKSTADVTDLIRKGAISYNLFAKAIDQATDAGGKFYKMSERMMETIDGQKSLLKDSTDDIKRTVAVDYMPTYQRGLQNILDSMKDIGVVVRGAMYGFYQPFIRIFEGITVVVKDVLRDLRSSFKQLGISKDDIIRKAKQLYLVFLALIGLKLVPFFLLVNKVIWATTKAIVAKVFMLGLLKKAYVATTATIGAFTTTVKLAGTGLVGFAKVKAMTAAALALLAGGFKVVGLAIMKAIGLMALFVLKVALIPLIILLFQDLWLTLLDPDADTFFNQWRKEYPWVEKWLNALRHIARLVRAIFTLDFEALKREGSVIMGKIDTHLDDRSVPDHSVIATSPGLGGRGAARSTVEAHERREQERREQERLKHHKHHKGAVERFFSSREKYPNIANNLNFLKGQIETLGLRDVDTKKVVSDIADGLRDRGDGHIVEKLMEALEKHNHNRDMHGPQASKKSLELNVKCNEILLT